MRSIDFNIWSVTVGGFMMFVAVVSSVLMILAYCSVILMLAGESLDEYWPLPFGLAVIGIVPLFGISYGSPRYRVFLVFSWILAVLGFHAIVSLYGTILYVSSPTQLTDNA